MKVIFCDVDGVLNSRRYILNCDNWDDPSAQMDPKAVARLNKITDITGAKIVISSSWRLSYLNNLIALKECFSGYGITGDIVGMTPEMITTQKSNRRHEILSYLQEDASIDHFVIIDDEKIIGLLSHQIKTSFDDGLLDSHVDEAIRLLGFK